MHSTIVCLHKSLSPNTIQTFAVLENILCYRPELMDTLCIVHVLMGNYG